MPSGWLLMDTFNAAQKEAAWPDSLLLASVHQCESNVHGAERGTLHGADAHGRSWN